VLKHNVTKFIDEKAADLNNQGDLAYYVAKKIKCINDYIDQKKYLSDQQLEDVLSEIVGFFTTSLHVSIEKETKFLRARAYKSNHLENDVTKLSYIPQHLNHIAKIGRLNREKKPVYYGCIYFGGIGGVNVAFSESNAEENDTINVLRSKAIHDMNVYFVGILDFVHRHAKPKFINDSMFEYFTEVCNYQEKQFAESVHLAHILCDAFLSDILRRQQRGNLYNVTSRLFEIFTEKKNIDGIVYTSVKSEGDPVIALKTNSVDTKISHVSCDCYKIVNDYGYAKYHVIHTHCGSINNNLIKWNGTISNKIN
jgi:hypothetical protein